MIETERLELRPLSEQDIEAWAGFLADPAATRLLHTPDAIDDRERALAGLRAWVARFEEPIGMYALTIRETRERPGFVGFVARDLDRGPELELELGWLLLPEFWGRGYATEAARALRPLAPSRVVSMIRVENEASVNVARKLGMHVEREVVYHGFQTGVWVSPAPGSA